MTRDDRPGAMLPVVISLSCGGYGCRLEWTGDAPADLAGLAGYLRDLAGRHGAEPAPPDSHALAGMLVRILAQDSGRRVTLRDDDGSPVLVVGPVGAGSGREADMARLMSGLDNRMSTAETVTSPGDLLQQRIAATLASADDGQAAPDAEAAYRDDLDQLVRPRRPSVRTGRTARPGQAMPGSTASPPDRGGHDPRSGQHSGPPLAPVRPRRVNDPADVVTGFAAFLAGTGATTPEAVVLAAIEWVGRSADAAGFTRRQVLRLVRSAAPISRAEAFAAFDALLADGQIEERGFRHFVRAAPDSPGATET
ncbi:hypothetical protein [Pukyongiella litopenaei]|uniref:Uncharacterized protein n=1 Tax=Pukyongiella litopenaei TaxID=2605946 RepID=A0A2S0MM55_9RHOB|nr:hypothetical protein [Pukyongiella litopenaei]AVO36964.2 hypothetical protein C6Y53_04125 [Pukyongiella litopenaei]